MGNPQVPWNLSVTRNLVRDLFGEDQCQLLEPVLEALRDRQRFARLHYQCASKALHEYLPEELPLAEVIVRTNPWEAAQRGVLDDCLTLVEANVIACAQSMHALLDNLAHAVYFGMGMNLDSRLRLKARQINLSNIKSRAAGLEGTNRLSRVLDKIGERSTYLAALVNHGKHRSLVPIVLHVDPSIAGEDTTAAYRLEFAPFTHDHEPYQARTVFDFLEQDYRRLSEQIVEAGCVLNGTLQERAVALRLVR